MAASARRPPFVALIAPLLLAACTVGPNYQRPKIDAPPQFRDATATTQSLADTKWFELFKDDKLTELVKTALAVG